MAKRNQSKWFLATSTSTSTRHPSFSPSVQTMYDSSAIAWDRDKHAFVSGHMGNYEFTWRWRSYVEPPNCDPKVAASILEFFLSDEAKEKIFQNWYAHDVSTCQFCAAGTMVMIRRETHKLKDWHSARKTSLSIDFYDPDWQVQSLHINGGLADSFRRKMEKITLKDIQTGIFGKMKKSVP